jgi:hypothetical protein
MYIMSDCAILHAASCCSGLLGVWTLSIVWYSKKHKRTTFWKLDLFPFSGEGWETPTLLGPLEGANLNHWTTYNFRNTFKIKHPLRSSHMKTRPEGDLQQMPHCICSIPCECGRSYIGEIGRPLAMRLCERRHNLKEGLLENQN